MPDNSDSPEYAPMFTELFLSLADAMDTAAPDLAAAQRRYYEQLVEQGFSEDEALELLKEMEMSANAQ